MKPSSRAKSATPQTAVKAAPAKIYVIAQNASEALRELSGTLPGMSIVLPEAARSADLPEGRVLYVHAQQAWLSSAIDAVPSEATVCIWPADEAIGAAALSAWSARSSAPDTAWIATAPGSAGLAGLLLDIAQPTGLDHLPAGASILPAHAAKALYAHAVHAYSPLEELYRLRQLGEEGTALAIGYAHSLRIGELTLDSGVPAVQPAAALATPLRLFFRFFWEKNVLNAFRTPFLPDWRNSHHGMYRLAFLVSVLFMLIFTPLMSVDYGITWDEPVMQEYAEDVYRYYTSGGQDRIVFDLEKRHARNAMIHYGASFDLYAYLLKRFVLTGMGIYEVRHLLIALMGVLGIVFIGRISAALSSWRTAFIAAWCTYLTPLYFGHSMNNPKDIPFLFGYAVGIFYLIRLLNQLPRPKFGTLFWLTFGLSYMISIKIGGLILAGYIGLFCGLWWIWSAYKDGLAQALKALPRYALYLGSVLIIGYFWGILLWPWGIEAPLTNPLVSLTEFTNFRFLIAYELFEGKRIFMDNPPAHYTFKWIAITVPVFVLLGFLVGLLPLRQRMERFSPMVWAVLVFAFLFPVIYTIAKNSTLYSSWRHLLFIYAAFTPLAARGWEYLIMLTQAKRALRLGVMTVLIGFAARPVIWMITNHPNEYVYFNEVVGGINGAYTNYETDYWCNSMKQASEWLLVHAPEIKQRKVRVAANFEINSALYFFRKETDSVQVLWTRENEKYKEDWDYAFFGTRGMSKEFIQNCFPPKGTIHVIKADTVPLLAIVKKEDRSLFLAHQATKKNNVTEALMYAEKAVAYDPRNVEAHRMLAMTCMNLRDYAKAKTALQTAIRLNPDDFSAYTLLGICLNNTNEAKEAIGYFNKAIKLKINNTSAYQNRAQSYVMLQDYDQALKNYELALQYDGGANGPAGIARIYFDASFALIKQAEAYPGMAQNRYGLAVRNLEEALRLVPNFPEAYQNLSYIYGRLGDQKTADMYYQQFMQLMQQGGGR